MNEEEAIALEAFKSLGWETFRDEAWDAVIRKMSGDDEFEVVLPVRQLLSERKMTMIVSTISTTYSKISGKIAGQKSRCYATNGMRSAELTGVGGVGASLTGRKG